MPGKADARMQSNRWRCSDEFWAFVEPLLPVHVNQDPLGRGRHRREDRDAMDAILFVLRTGCQWNALNATGICSSSTAHRRFQEWTQAGVFLKLWQSGLEVYDELKGLDWALQGPGGAMTKAPLGGKKPARIPRIGANPAPSEVCGSKRTASRWGWPSGERTGTTSSWRGRRWKAFP